jgi:uncharacterized protein
VAYAIAVKRWIVALAGVLLSLAPVACSPSPASNPGTATVVINGETFNLELALDDQAREMGLKHRTSIPDRGGMLFVFPDDKLRVQSFWMHECLVDMDIIYLDPRGRVTATYHMKALPPKQAGESEDEYRERVREKAYSSGYPAQFVIEVQAGSLERLNVKFEQKIDLDIPRLKAMAR